MSQGHEKEVHRSCPFKSPSSVSTSQEVGRYTSPREMCTHNCALYDEKEQACAIRVIATRLGQPHTFALQSAGTLDDMPLSE